MPTTNITTATIQVTIVVAPFKTFPSLAIFNIIWSNYVHHNTKLSLYLKYNISILDEI
jgi:hypothetical protein